MSEVVILVANSGLGSAEKVLREKMMGVFLRTLDTFPPNCRRKSSSIPKG